MFDTTEVLRICDHNLGNHRDLYGTSQTRPRPMNSDHKQEWELDPGPMIIIVSGCKRVRAHLRYEPRVQNSE